jgi:hypothetical protein
MRSEIMEGENSFKCVDFWYWMYSFDKFKQGKLNVWLNDYQSGNRTLLWTVQYSTERDWVEGRFSYKYEQQHRIIFEGIQGEEMRDIAIDDISFSESSHCSYYPVIADPSLPTTLRPTTTRQTTTPSSSWISQSPIDCNFETDFCGWQNATGSDGIWQRGNGKTTSFFYNTGPTKDHTFQTVDGYFIYINTNYPAKLNDKYRLQSISLTPEQSEKCFEFWYHMYGADITALNIYLLQHDQLSAPVWSRSKNQGDQWLRGELRIPRLKESYNIIFEGVRGRYPLGVIGLDDVRLLPSCPARENRFCDFESEDICGYTTSDGAIKWTRQLATDNSEGPDTDHTTGSQFGYYMFTAGVSQDEDVRATLTTNKISPNNEQCAEFFYYHKPSGAGNLNIYAIVVEDDKESEYAKKFPIWTEPLVNTGKPGWKIAQVSLGHGISSKPYKVIFEEFVEGKRPGIFKTF